MQHASTMGTQEERERDGLTTLPFELFLAVTYHLEPLDLARLARVSRQCHRHLASRRMRRAWIRHGRWTLFRVLDSTPHRVPVEERWHAEEARLLLRDGEWYELGFWYAVRHKLVLGRRPRLLRLVL